MASFSIHLAVGKKYMEKNHVENEILFMRGIVHPDFVSDKDKSHYTSDRNDNSLFTHLSTKIYLPSFLKENMIDTDYKKGVFLHLITDYVFFNSFFDKDYILNESYEGFCKDLYYSYDLTNDYLQEKYNIDLSDFEDNITINRNIKDKKFNQNQDRKNILDILELDKFIEKVSNVDLEKYKKDVLEANTNILI